MRLGPLLNLFTPYLMGIVCPEQPVPGLHTLVVPKKYCHDL